MKIKNILIITLVLFFSKINAQDTISFDNINDKSSFNQLIRDNQKYSTVLPMGDYLIAYSLKGVFIRKGEENIFYTFDGRVFKLLINKDFAQKYEGKNIKILAKAKQSDDIETLKVEEITEFNPQSEIKLPNFLNKTRPAHLIKNENDFMTISNIRWNKGNFQENKFDWSTAKINLNAIKNIYFIKKPFPPESVAAHSLMLFTFEKGAIVDENNNTTDSLALSIEAYLQEGQSYSLKEGLGNNFFIVWALIDWKDYVYRTVNFEKDTHKLFAYPLLINKEQKIKLLKESLLNATINREGEYYNTITNNCTNNLIILINKVLNNKAIKMWVVPSVIYNYKATMPVMVPSYLQKKGILGKELPEINISNYLNYSL